MSTAAPAKAPRPRVELYQRADGRWSWRQVARNGQVTEVPGQGFASKWSAKRSAKRARPELPVVEV